MAFRAQFVKQDNENTMPKDLYIEYKGRNETIDDMITSAIESIGYELTGSGFQIETKTSDLHFKYKSG